MKKILVITNIITLALLSFWVYKRFTPPPENLKDNPVYTHIVMLKLSLHNQ